jgi:hypothetical protein
MDWCADLPFRNKHPSDPGLADIKRTASHRPTLPGGTITKANFVRELGFPKSLYGDLSQAVLDSLEGLVQRHKISLVNGDLKYLNSGWYISHSGLLRLAERRSCAGIHVRQVLRSCDPPRSGFGDADPSNVSASVHGAEMRVAETVAHRSCFENHRPHPAGLPSLYLALVLLPTFRVRLIFCGC